MAGDAPLTPTGATCAACAEARADLAAATARALAAEARAAEIVDDRDQLQAIVHAAGLVRRPEAAARGDLLASLRQVREATRAHEARFVESADRLRREGGVS